jgi:hypothetical protein
MASLPEASSEVETRLSSQPQLSSIIGAFSRTYLAFPKKKVNHFYIFTDHKLKSSY